MTRNPKSRFNVESRERKSRNGSDCDRYYVITDRKHRGFICFSVHASYPKSREFANEYCTLLNRLNQ